MSLQQFCPSCLARLPVTRWSPMTSSMRTIRPAIAATQIHYNQLRTAVTAQKKKGKAKKKKVQKEMATPDLSKMPQFSLVDAMRYIRASEVGYPPTSAKYELAIRLRTLKSGAVLRGQLRLPHAIDTSERICVIVDPNSPAAKQAIAAGASLVGEEIVFDAVKEGRIEFERCLCHVDSAPKLAKANLGRILGPKGLMPSVKLGTVVKNVSAAVQNATGGTIYRERMGVVRLRIGQLGYTPVQLQANIKAFMAQLKKNMSELRESLNKDIHEVVLSSTHGPGISLNGSLTTADSPDMRDLSTVS